MDRFTLKPCDCRPGCENLHVVEGDDYITCGLAPPQANSVCDLLNFMDQHPISIIIMKPLNDESEMEKLVDLAKKEGANVHPTIRDKGVLN